MPRVRFSLFAVFCLCAPTLWAEIALPNADPPFTGTGVWYEDIRLSADAAIVNNGALTIGEVSGTGKRASQYLHAIYTDGFELSLEGSGDTLIQSNILGSGSVSIDLESSSAKVTYKTLYETNGGAPETYTGTTFVKSGTLELWGTRDKNDTLIGDLIVGGEGSEAIVTRYNDTLNRELIGDSVNITLADGGTFKVTTASQLGQFSKETIGSLALSGGTLLNESTLNTELIVTDGLTLSENSMIELGEGGMKLSFGESQQIAWEGTLIIEDYYSSNQGTQHTSTIRFGTDASSLTEDQLGRIFFKNPDGDSQLWHAGLDALGYLSPITPVPEPGTFVAGALALSLCIRRFLAKR